MATDLDLVQDSLEGMFAGTGLSDGAGQLTRTLRRYEVRTRLSLDTNADVGVGANVNVTEKVFYRVPVASRVVAVKFTADTANYAGDATNVRTLAVRKRAGTAFGDTAATVASLAFDTPTTDDVTQWVPKDITVDGAQVALTAGSILSFQLTQNTGSATAAFPAGDLVVTVEEA
jgi:hypothetical protein